MSNLCIAVLFVLLVIFIIIALDAVFGKKYESILTYAECGDDDIECRLRAIMRKNPNSEIIVVDKSQSAETRIILEKLADDYPEIHVLYI